MKQQLSMMIKANIVRFFFELYIMIYKKLIQLCPLLELKLLTHTGKNFNAEQLRLIVHESPLDKLK